MEPYTEAPNVITRDIDVSSPEEIVTKLQQCDLEMFSPLGLQGNPQTLYSDVILNSIVNLSNHLREAIKLKNSIVVMTGCGTSGRIAFMISRTFQNYFKVGHEKITYAIAGGDIALFTSQEAPEDDNRAGVRDLLRICQDKQHVLLVGISCGLSAPYVAGQLDYCMNNLEKFVPVLLGFNPISLARNVPIQGWDKTFLTVAKRLQSLVNEGKSAIIINPVLGGEAITGSSRMKGGSITKVVLEVAFLMAATDVKWPIESCRDLLASYSSACTQLYESSSSAISKIVSAAGSSLKRCGHIYQAASDGTAVLGIIDATECPPTYGATLDDIRGFIFGGYPNYGNVEGDLSHEGDAFCIDAQNLSSLLKQGSSHCNTVLFIAEANDPLLLEMKDNRDLGKQLLQCDSEIFVVVILENDEPEPILPTYLQNIVCFRLQTTGLLPKSTYSFLSAETEKLLVKCTKEICAKWIFNAVSTGAHVMKGKVFKNYMVDLKVSNQKLFHRSVGIIMRFCSKLTQDEAKQYLLRSIYKKDNLDPVIANDTVSSHVLAATPLDKVVPTAIVMSIKKCNYLEAAEALNKFHVIRDALISLLQNSM